MKHKLVISLFLLILGSPHWVIAGDGGGSPDYPEIIGVMGIVPPLEDSCAAIWVAIPEGPALSGIEWYNNDGLVVFPGLYFESGVPEYPLALDETILAAENVVGNSSAWSSVTFSEPVTCASEGLYVLFRFPAGIQATAFGEGGGPAIGYLGQSQGAPGWLCSDGENWKKVGGEFGFAVLPIFVDANPGMLQLLGGPGEDRTTELIVPLVTGLEAPFPNPFNPNTELHFSVAEGQNVELSVFDIRGHLVRRLAQGYHEAGRYEVLWQGDDQNGRRMASGVYFARFSAGNTVMNHRLALVK